MDAQPVTLTPEQAVKDLIDLKAAAVNTATKAELKDLYDKVEAKLIDVQRSMAEATRPKLHGSSGDGMFKHVRMTKEAQGNPAKMLHAAIRHPAKKGSELEEFQTIADAVHLYAAIAQSGKAEGDFTNRFLKSELVGIYNSYMQELTGKDVAIDTTEFTTWIIPPSQTSGFRDRVRDAQQLGPLFVPITMLAPTHKEPGLSADHNTYTIAENTATEGTKFPGTVPVPYTAQLDAVKECARVGISTESMEDFGPGRADELLSRFARVMADGLDRCIVNGDITGAHRDTGDGIATNDSRKMFMGLRYSAIDSAFLTTPLASPTITPDILIDSRKAMGKYGGSQGRVNTVFHLGSYGQYFNLVKNTDLKLLINYGPNATIVKGEFVPVAGVPFFPTEWIFATGYTAAGVHTGAGTRGCALTVHGPGWGLGTWRDITIRASDVVAMEYDQVIVVGTWRGDWEDLYPIATNRIVDYIVDVNP